MNSEGTYVSMILAFVRRQEFQIWRAKSIREVRRRSAELVDVGYGGHIVALKVAQLRHFLNHHQILPVDVLGDLVRLPLPLPCVVIPHDPQPRSEDFLGVLSKWGSQRWDCSEINH